MDSFLPSASNVILPSTTSKPQSGPNRRRRLKTALKRIQKRILKEKSKEQSPLARFRIQWVRSAFKMEKIPNVERRNIFEQFENIFLGKEKDSNIQVPNREVPVDLVREDIMPTLSAEISVLVSSNENKPEEPEEPDEGLLCEEEMPTRLAEYYHTSNTLGIDIGEGSNDSDISMEVNTSKSPPLIQDDYVELLSTIDGILQSDDDNFVI